MKDYPNPCEKCIKNGTNFCLDKKCVPWLTRYLYRQKQINAYAKKVIPEHYAKVNGGDGGGGK